MNSVEIARHISAIIDQQYEDGQAVTWVGVVDAARSTIPSEELEAIAHDAIQAFLANTAKQQIRKKVRDESEQLQLPGFGSFDNSVTVPVTEGAFGVKKITCATLTELHHNHKLKADNARNVNARLEALERFMDLVLPVMEENGFETVLDALQHLGLA